MSAGAPLPPRSSPSATSPSRSARRATTPAWRAASAPGARALEVVHRRRDHRRLLGALRDLRRAARAPGSRSPRTRSTSLQSPSADNWFGTDRLGRDVFSRVIVGARDIMIIAPAATAPRHGPRDRAGPRHGLLPRHRRRRAEPPHRGRARAAGRARRHAGDRLARPVEPHDHPRRRLRVRPGHRAHGARRGAQRARARVRRRGAIAQREDALHPVRRDPART